MNNVKVQYKSIGDIEIGDIVILQSGEVLYAVGNGGSIMLVDLRFGKIYDEQKVDKYGKVKSVKIGNAVSILKNVEIIVKEVSEYERKSY